MPAPVAPLPDGCPFVVQVFVPKRVPTELGLTVLGLLAESMLVHFDLAGVDFRSMPVSPQLIFALLHSIALGQFESLSEKLLLVPSTPDAPAPISLLRRPVPLALAAMLLRHHESVLWPHQWLVALHRSTLAAVLVPAEPTVLLLHHLLDPFLSDMLLNS